MTKNGSIKATVKVTNTGKYDGDEVVQMYIGDKVASVSRPLKELKGFKKVNIPAGKTVEVSFEITDELLKFYNADMIRASEPGEFNLFIGGSSQTNNSTVFTLN